MVSRGHKHLFQVGDCTMTTTHFPSLLRIPPPPSAKFNAGLQDRPLAAHKVHYLLGLRTLPAVLAAFGSRAAWGPSALAGLNCKAAGIRRWDLGG